MPAPGESYKLLKTLPSADGLATIYVGQVVKVRELVSADTKGAGRDDEDSVVVEFDVLGEVVDESVEPERIMLFDEAGQPILNSTTGEQRYRPKYALKQGAIQRASAFSVAEFTSMFEAL